MAYKHGIYVNTTNNTPESPVDSPSGLQVVFGNAPINLAESLDGINQPIVCETMAEAKRKLGYSDDWEKYPLCESMYASFVLYKVAPVVFINLLDPNVHKKDGSQSINLADGKSIINQTDIFLDSIEIRSEAGAPDKFERNVDYVVSFELDGTVLVRVMPTGNIPSDQTTLFVTYTLLDPSKLTITEIVGGTDLGTGKKWGLELLDDVFPKCNLVPGTILAPGLSHNPIVESVIKAKSTVINTFFKASMISDVDTEVVNHYSKVQDWKNDNDFVGTNEMVGWPLLGRNDLVFRFSTHLGALIAQVDANNNGIPSISPSNHKLQANKVLLNNGDEILLGPEVGNTLNGQGIMTAITFNGLRMWGNRSGNYGSDFESTEPSERFNNMNRMRYWISNQIILKTWHRVDSNIGIRLANSICDELNIWFNGLVATNNLIGGRVEFRREDNTNEDLADGKIKFKVFLAESAPAEDIEFDVEFDSSYYDTLFSE